MENKYISQNRKEVDIMTTKRVENDLKPHNVETIKNILEIYNHNSSGKWLSTLQSI